MSSPAREIVLFPSWTAGREGYAARIREVFQEFLAARGLRLTHQRQAIVDVLLHADKHLSSPEVYKALKGRGIGRVTVFRTIKMLEEARLAERVHSPDGVPKFEIKYERPRHDHLICVECGAIREVQWPQVERIRDRTCRQLRFIPIWHRYEVFGRCADCESRRKS
jgi:Fur family ferric uptake transcriptional regulator